MIIYFTIMGNFVNMVKSCLKIKNRDIDINTLSKEQLKDYIVKDLLQPSIIADIQDMLKWKYWWRKIGNYLSTLSHLLIIISAIFAFAETYFQQLWIAFAAGCISLFGVYVARAADLAHKESESHTKEINKLLKDMNIEEIPDGITDTVTSKSNKKSDVVSSIGDMPPHAISDKKLDNKDVIIEVKP